ncbi:MAG: class I adenylate-forming enzyme family protein, partial [Pseudomonadota bacterium]
MKISADTPPEGTVSDWLNARADKGGVAFTFPETGETLTWPELRDHAAKTAGDLTAQGIAKGESVAVVHPNGLSGVKALYSALYGGFRVTMINLAAGPDAITYALEHSEARVAFVHDDQLAMFDEAKPVGLSLYAPSGATAPLHDIAPQDDAL